MVSRQETSRALLTPGEVMQLPPEDELVLISGCHPIRAKKARYYEDQQLQARDPRRRPNRRAAARDRGLLSGTTSRLHRPGRGRLGRKLDRRAASNRDRCDPDNAGIRRVDRNSLEHEEIVPAPRRPAPDFALSEDEPDDDAQRLRAVAAPGSASDRAPGQRSIPAQQTTWDCERQMRIKHTVPPATGSRRQAGRLRGAQTRAAGAGGGGGARLASVARMGLDRLGGGPGAQAGSHDAATRAARTARHAFRTRRWRSFVRFWLTSTPPLARAPLRRRRRRRVGSATRASSKRLGVGWRKGPHAQADEIAADIGPAGSDGGGSEPPAGLIGDPAGRFLSSLSQQPYAPHQPCCARPFPTSSNQPCPVNPPRRGEFAGVRSDDDLLPIRKLSPAAARMLRTAPGPAIAGYLEDPSIVEVMSSIPTAGFGSTG